MYSESQWSDPWFWFCAWGVASLLFAALWSLFRWIEGRIEDHYRDKHAVRRMRRVALLACLALMVPVIAGAADKPWKSVTIAANSETVEHCVYVADVDASAKYIINTPSATPNAAKLALKRLRIRTYRAGGDVVLVTEFKAGGGRAYYEGEAYDCDNSE